MTNLFDKKSRGSCVHNVLYPHRNCTKCMGKAIARLRAIIDRSGDVCPCSGCGKPVVCVGEGIRLCLTCGDKEMEE